MTPQHPVEIELKLSLPADQVAPFLNRMARRRSVPLQQDIVTRYFDTPDFALSSQGIALRVRKIGQRWLQALKTEGERQGGLSRRIEYEMAIPANTPDWNRFPVAAQARVPEVIRTQLIPLFETHFNRTTWLVSGRGGAKIEVALDVGEVRAGTRSQPICEIELELKAGKPDALFELAQAWATKLDLLPLDVSKAERGVRLARGEIAAPMKSVPVDVRDDMRVEEGFSVIVQACLAQFQANLPGVLASEDIDYVHQARVALRRLRAALHVFRRVCTLPDELLNGLRVLSAALGPVRDWDVLCGETMPAIASHFADEGAWQFGLSVLEAHRAEARAAMRAEVFQARPGAWLLSFQRWLIQQGWREGSAAQHQVQQSALKAWARRKLRKGNRLIEQGARAYAQMRPAAQHALRITVKRQRYAAEFFVGMFVGRRQARYQTALQVVQESLGRINDYRVASRLLTQAGAEAGSMGAFSRGWLAACRAGDDNKGIKKQLKNFVKWVPGW